MKKVIAMVNEVTPDVLQAMEAIHTRNTFFNKYVDALKEEARKKERELSDLNDKDWTVIKEWLVANKRWPDGAGADPTFGFSLKKNTISYDDEDESEEPEAKVIKLRSLKELKELISTLEE